MPRPRRDRIKPLDIGRPIKPINWDIVDELLLSGCSGAQIAGQFDMHPETFYERCQIEKGTGFTGYSSTRTAKGEAILKHHQYKKAIGKTKDGDTTLLVHLGKCRLGQKEADTIMAEDTVKAFSSVMDYFSKMQKSNTSEESSSQ